MKYTVCARCGNTNTQVNNSISVDGVILCGDCFKETFTDGELLKGKKVLHVFDPTICASCNADFDQQVLSKIGSYPICESCHQGLQQRIAPLWVKAFFAGVIALVIFSFFWNWRFFLAHDEIEASSIALGNQDFRLAADLMKQAYGHANEVSDLKAMASYFNGMALLHEDKSEEAFTELSSCRDILPEDYGIDALIMQAQIGMAFESKDYDQFLALTKEFLERDTTSGMAWASVASAYACLYATTGNDSLKVLSRANMARALDDDDPNIEEYLNRLEHRLSTREIIDSKEFKKRFPNGWSEN